MDELFVNFLDLIFQVVGEDRNVAANAIKVFAGIVVPGFSKFRESEDNRVLSCHQFFFTLGDFLLESQAHTSDTFRHSPERSDDQANAHHPQDQRGGKGDVFCIGNDI